MEITAQQIEEIVDAVNKRVEGTESDPITRDEVDTIVKATLAVLVEKALNLHTGAPPSKKPPNG